MNRRIGTLAALALAAAARAQNPADEGTLRVSGELRTLSGFESGQTYGSLQAEKGFSHARSFVVRITTSEKRTFVGNGFQVRHGGGDMEAALRVRRGAAVWEAGIALPDTSERKQLQATLRVQAERGRWLIGPRAVFGKGGTLAGLGVGRTAAWGARREAFAEATAILIGNNNRSLSDGTVHQSTLWGAGVRWIDKTERRSAALGVTNALGETTGMSLTSRLRGAALFLKLEVTR